MSLKYEPVSEPLHISVSLLAIGVCEELSLWQAANLDADIEDLSRSLTPVSRPDRYLPTPSPLSSEPYALNPKPYALNPKPYALNPKPYALNPKP